MVCRLRGKNGKKLCVSVVVEAAGTGSAYAVPIAKRCLTLIGRMGYTKKKTRVQRNVISTQEGLQ